jgi:hypothetical protein
MTEISSSIRRSARRLRLATLFATALVELAIAFAAWVLVAGRPESMPWLGIEVGGLPRGPAAIVLLLFGLLLGLALLRLVAMLRQIEGGAPFAAAGLRGFARWLFLAVFVSWLAPPLIFLAFGDASGHHHLRLSLDSSEALMLLVTGLLFFVARLLAEAERLADEHSQIV